MISFLLDTEGGRLLLSGVVFLACFFWMYYGSDDNGNIE